MVLGLSRLFNVAGGRWTDTKSSGKAKKCDSQEALTCHPSYRPLPRKPCTRLVLLHPGCQDDIVQLSLEVIDLDQRPKYIAISYAWGDPDNEVEITVDGCPVRIRHNLYTCLRTMRTTVTVLRLWIDCLSISQTDTDEKSQQVAMIGRIFSQATEVRAWLGEHENESQCLFSDLDLISEIRSRPLILLRLWTRRASHMVQSILFNCILPLHIWVVVRSIKSILTGDSELSRYTDFIGMAILPMIMQLHIWLRDEGQGGQFVGPTLTPAVYEYAFYFRPLQTFVARPYWRRLWVIQEIAVATKLTIWCGCDTMDWSQFASRYLGLDIAPMSVPVDLDSDTVQVSTLAEHQSIIKRADRRTIDFYYNGELGHLARLAGLRSGGYKLVDLMRMGKYSECDLRHDRVYALLSLEQRDSSNAVIVPNYRLSMAELALELLQTPSGPHRKGIRSILDVFDCLHLQAVEAHQALAQLGYNRLQILLFVDIYWWLAGDIETFVRERLKDWVCRLRMHLRL